MLGLPCYSHNVVTVVQRMAVDVVDNVIKCLVCNELVPDFLHDHLLTSHGKTVFEYSRDFPTSPVMLNGPPELKNPTRSLPPNPDNLTVRFGSSDFHVNHDVSPDDCLPFPEHYVVPNHGSSREDLQHVSVSLKHNRSIYIWGMPGTGKDACIHAWSAMTRTPAVIRQISPDTDVESWFFSRGVNNGSTVWEEGELLLALRDGYLTSTGRRIPYLILLSDFDRAELNQAEHIRMITDSIMGRVKGPAGRVYKVMPGTIIVATANTSGGGDERGRMLSSRPLDASLTERFQRKYQVHWMDWKDESQVLMAKFPKVFGAYPGLEPKLLTVTKSLREMVTNGELHGEFTHRSLCDILSHVSDIMAESVTTPSFSVIGYASRVWTDGLPDEENRLLAKKVLDAHFKTL